MAAAAPKSRAAPSPRPKKAKSAPRSRLLVDERRAQLISLGLSIFSTRSYDEVSIDDLAAAAGVSKGLLYHYFPTKRAFYIAALENAAASLLGETANVPMDDPAERLHRDLNGYFDFVEKHGHAFVALMRGGIGSDKEVSAIVERTRGAFVTRILDFVPKELVVPTLRSTLRGWIGNVEAVSIDWFENKDVDRVLLIRILSASLRSALKVATEDLVGNRLNP